MTKMMKNLLLGVAAILGGVHASVACTGISLTAADGSYIQARTIEWAYGALKSEYVIIPRGEALQSYTPTGMNGMKFKARYGVVGLAVVEMEFIDSLDQQAVLVKAKAASPRKGKLPVMRR